METYTLLHHLSLVVCLLMLPRLKSPLSVANNSEDVEDLVLTRVGYMPAHGMYVCLTRSDGVAPDLGLQYTATYTHGHPRIHTSCNGDLTYQGAELGWFCLPPCPRVEAANQLHPVTLVVIGHDRTTTDTTAALVESLTISDVVATVVQVGRGVVEVRWTGRPGRMFEVQLLHHLHSVREEAARDEGETEDRTSASDGIDGETLMKMKQCYHESDYNDEDDDDDDNDDNDHEEDNDDFLKWRRWRRCVALYSLRAPVPSTAAPPALVHTSGQLSCFTKTCLYYITEAPTSGCLSAVVMDVTHSPVHASHTAPTHLREWTALHVETVMISYECIEADQRTKVMTITVLYERHKEGAATIRKIAALGKAAVAEEENMVEEDVQAVVINGHSHSEALKSLPGDCDQLRLSGTKGVVCSVKTLETLVDPEGLGPISSLLLLLTSENTAASTLLAITDVHVRVREVEPGVVLVLWDRDTTVQEFIVSVVQESGAAYNTSTVGCDKRGSDCLVAFHGLLPGRYIAEVSYERQARVLQQAPFTIEEEIV